MQNYIVRVYRANAGNSESISGLIEDIESGHKEPFHGINELQALLAKSIVRGQLEFSSLSPAEAKIDDNIAVVA
jgi:hypothetical protein